MKKFTTEKNQSVVKGTQGKTGIQEGEERHDNVGKTHKLKVKCQPFNEKKMEHKVREQASHTARLPTSRDRHRGGPHRARRGEGPGNSKDATLKDNEWEMQQNSNFYKFQEEPRRTSSPRSRRRCQEESR